MGFLICIKAEVVRGFIIMRRYWFATLTSMAIGYGTLVAIIYGFMKGADTVQIDFAAQATGGILGFMIGVFGFGIVGLFTQALAGMAARGELEQVCMSPHGLVTNFLARSFVSAVMSIISSTIMVTLVALQVKGKLHAAPGPTLALLALTYLNLIGFGYMVGGLVLVFKQVGQVAIIVRMVIIGIAIVATDEGMAQWPGIVQGLAHVLPITDAAICLKLVLIDGVGAAVFSHPSFYFLLVSCVIWTSIGITLFKYFENLSRDKGTLGAF